MKIITNNQARDVLYAWQLTDKERSEFDYHDDIDSPDCCATFVRYKGQVYDLGEFVNCTQSVNGFSDWHGIRSDTFFSGVLVKYTNDFESVIVGRYFS
jgi:hypothetical protein